MSAPEVASAPVPAAVESTRWAAVACTLGLVLVALVRTFWIEVPTQGLTRAKLLVLLLAVAPLLAAVPGLLRRRMYTYRWLSLLVWLYFLLAVVRATSESGPGVPLAVLETLLAVVLFAACALHVRLRLRSRPAP